MRTVTILACVCAVIGVLVVPAIGLTANQSASHFKEVGTFTDVDFCGSGGLVEGTFDINGTNFLTPNQGVEFRQTAQAKYGYTNPSTGVTVRVHAAGRFLLEVVSSTPDGSMLLVTNQGLPEQIKTSHGPILTRDAGYLQLRLTLDSDGELVASEILIDRGPHPEAESDMALFCQVTTTALGL